MSRPVKMRWDGESFRPVSRQWARAADAEYAIGEERLVTAEHERSHATHAHEFVWLRDAWESLPEHLAGEYPSEEHLRKRALIATGYCTVKDYVCISKAAARRQAAVLTEELDEYAVVIVSERVVRVLRAESQSRKSMGAERFQKSKTAILDWVSALLGVEPAQLQAIAAGRSTRRAA